MCQGSWSVTMINGGEGVGLRAFWTLVWVADPAVDDAPPPKKIRNTYTAKAKQNPCQMAQCQTRFACISIQPVGVPRRPVLQCWQPGKALNTQSLDALERASLEPQIYNWSLSTWESWQVLDHGWLGPTVPAMNMRRGWGFVISVWKRFASRPKINLEYLWC